MDNFSFKEWIELQETGTSTASISGFSRISIPLVRRTAAGELAGAMSEEDPFFKKLRKKKKKKSEE